MRSSRVERARIVAGILAIGVVLAAGLALAGGNWPAVEMYSHFVPALLVAALGLGTLTAILHLRAATMAMLAVTVVLTLRAGPYLLPPTDLASPPADASAPMRVTWANVQNWSTGGESVTRVLELRPDIAIFTELSGNQVRAIEMAKTDYPFRTPFPRSSAFDVMLLSRWTPRSWSVEFPHGYGYAFVTARFCDGPARPDDRCTTIVARHAVRPRLPLGFVGQPPVHRDQLLQEGARRAAIHVANGDRVVLVGDLNVTPWSASFRDVLATSGLGDSATMPAEKPRVPLPTWFSIVPGIGLPIDHALVGPGLRIVERRLGPNIGSDHRPLILDLRAVPR